MQETITNQIYISSAPLNPQTRHAIPIELLNSQILDQAYNIKRHLKKQSSAQRRSQGKYTPFSNQYDKTSPQSIEKQSKKNNSSLSSTPARQGQWTKNQPKEINLINSTIRPKEEEKRDDEDQRMGHFGMITMYCLRKRNEKLEETIRSYQSEFKYVSKKLSNLKRMRGLSQIQFKKIEEISLEKKKKSEELKQALKLNQQLNRKKNQESRQQVLSHRIHKQKSVQKNQTEKFRIASRLRHQAQNQRRQRQKSQQLDINEKRICFVREKVNQFERKKSLNKNTERIRIQARTRFRNRWLQQFQQNEQLQKQSAVVSEQYSKKIKATLTQMSQIQLMQDRE